jgi:hypothetical protein
MAYMEPVSLSGAISFGWWLVVGADLFWEKNTHDWLLVAGLFWQKSIAGWWLISQTNRACLTQTLWVEGVRVGKDDTKTKD